MDESQCLSLLFSAGIRALALEFCLLVPSAVPHWYRLRLFARVNGRIIVGVFGRMRAGAFRCYHAVCAGWWGGVGEVPLLRSDKACPPHCEIVALRWFVTFRMRSLSKVSDSVS